MVKKNDSSIYTPPTAHMEENGAASDLLKRNLRFGIVTWWITMPIFFVLSVVSESWLPEPLQTFLKAEYEKDIDVWEILMFIIALIVLAGLIISSIALYYFKRWGAYGFFVLYLFSYLLVPLLEPTVEHQIMNFADLEIIAIGFILGVLFSSNGRCFQGEA